MGVELLYPAMLVPSPFCPGREVIYACKVDSKRTSELAYLAKLLFNPLVRKRDVNYACGIEHSRSVNIPVSLCIQQGARLDLPAVRPRNVPSSAKDAIRVMGCYQECFPSVGGLEGFYT